MNINIQVFEKYFYFLLPGVGVTLYLTVISVAIGVFVGLITSLGKISNIKFFKWITTMYIDFTRGTPLLAQIFFIHYGLPQIFGYMPNMLIDAIISLSLNSGAYIAEVFRSGIESIDKGQMDAGSALGFTKIQCMRYIILPQAFRRVIPPLGNVFISMLKDSSMVSVISMQDLTFRGILAAGKSFRPFEIWIMVSFLYLFMTLPFTRLVSWYEIKMRQRAM